MSKQVSLDLKLIGTILIHLKIGVLVLFVVNLIFTQRIIRATHPNLGWAKTFSWAFKIYYGCIVALLVAIITVTVQSFYTLDKSIRKADRDVQLFVGTFFAVSAFLPIPLVLGSIIIPKKVRVEKFGSGRFRTKIYLILFTSVILTLGAAFRVGTNFVPRPRNNPAWYNSKACFYLFNFTIEIIVVALYIGIRVDKRFHVPDNSHKYGDYSRKPGTSEPEQDVEQQQEKVKLRPSLVDRVNTEEQIFDDLDADTQVGTPQPSQGVDVDGILTTNHAGRSPVDAFPALQAKKATSDALYQVHNRYMDVVKYSKTLDEVERNKLLKRWEVELADFTRASVGSSLHDWMNKDQNAPEEIPIDQTDSSRG